MLKKTTSKHTLRIPHIEIRIATVLFFLLCFVLFMRIGSSVFVKLHVFITQYFQGAGYERMLSGLVQWVSSRVQWTGELSRWLWVWMVMLGLCESARLESHLKIDFIFHKMPARLASLHACFFTVAYLCAMLVIFYFSFQELLRSYKAMSSTLPLSNFYLYASVPVGFFFLSLRLFLRLLRQTKILFAKKE